MKPTILLGLVILAALASTAALLVDFGQKSQEGPADPGNAQQVALGEKIYRENCAVCHGANLEGQPNWQTRRADGRLPAPPHNETGHTWHHADEVLFRITKEGIAALVPDYESDMPVYGDILTDEEIWAALAFIKSRWPQDIKARHAKISQEK